MSSDSSRDRLATALGDDAKNVVMERGYSLGFVGVHGQVRLVQFRLSKKGFALDAGTDDAEFTAMLDEFTAVVTRLLTERWGGIAAGGVRCGRRTDRAALSDRGAGAV